MPERKELPEAWAELKQAFWKVYEPPLLWLMRKTDRLARWLKM